MCIRDSYGTNIHVGDYFYANTGLIVLDQCDVIIGDHAFLGPRVNICLLYTSNYRSRSQFLNEVINPLMKSGEIYRDGKPKSPTALIKIKR